jgi:hypothetical protein
LRRDGENSATDEIDLGSHKLTHIGTPSNDNDGVNKKYVDNIMSSYLSSTSRLIQEVY